MIRRLCSFFLSRRASHSAAARAFSIHQPPHNNKIIARQQTASALPVAPACLVWRKKMLTVVCEKPGSLLALDRPKPERAPGETLVRIKRVGVCGTDLHIFNGNQPFLEYPRVMGHEFSGIVEQSEAGSGLEPGDVVYVMPYLSCGDCIACRQGKTNCCVRF